MQNDIILPKEKTKKQKNGTDTISRVFWLNIAIFNVN